MCSFCRGRERERHGGREKERENHREGEGYKKWDRSGRERKIGREAWWKRERYEETQG